MYLTTLIRSEEPDIQKMVDAMLKKILLYILQLTKRPRNQRLNHPEQAAGLRNLLAQIKCIFRLGSGNKY